ncbi:hypothetical protein RHMOL_Rhmol09G0248800 [Rhododendron molle]|uniref:Uncharacterized protein n=1 Tax=Rhododendron molle TaxID=49168 RepID=A0ACC0MHK5_RHOML|nr:hypothetical protein RHMOL_Rhmol09G0248800 [Rhododendron molle]
MGIMYLRRQEQGKDVDGAQAPPLPRQPLPTSSCGLKTSNETREQIEVGSIYEIDHEKLPPRTPIQLRSIRVAMVSEKTESNVSVRFPSFQSLQSYFKNGIREMYPELDEKFVMGTKLAEKMLNRKVPSQEFAEKKHSQEFWVVISTSSFRGLGDVVSKKAGNLFSELKGNGMVGWGVRRQVKFIGRHRESNPQSSSSFVREGDEEMDEGDEEEEEKIKEEEEEDEEEEDEEDEESLTEETKLTAQRKRRYSSRLVQIAKKAKRETQRNVNTKTKAKAKAKAKNHCKQIFALKNPQDRYKIAEKNLMEVMKAKGAVYGNPILRPELRAEARKRIGDTGLLDHLLKHMAGKVAPGGGERFRRRHNAEGAMEYWLESADLVDIRKEAGVQDPYWTPQPGWKLGDCPTQDPVCAKGLKQLKEETSILKRVMAEEMVSKKQVEEELTKLRKEVELLSQKRNEESQAIVVSNPSDISQKLDLDTSIVPLNSDLDSSLVKLEEISKLKSKMDQETRSGSALMGSTDCCAEKDKKQGEEERAAQAVEKKEVESDQLKAKATAREAENTAAAAKEKAAKIQRLKSGFRICKPQGTFLWPNNNSSNGNNRPLSSQVVVQVEDLMVVPTPPSVSSSTASAPPQLPYYHHYLHHGHPASPVKPLAERRAVTVTVSAVGDHSNFSTTTTTTTTTTTNKKSKTHINLNDLPINPGGDGFCGTPGSSSKTVNTTAEVPRVLPSAVKGDMSPSEVVGRGDSGGKAPKSCNTMSYNEQQHGGCSSSSAPSATSCSPKGVGNWLALATPTPAQKDSNRG